VGFEDARVGVAVGIKLGVRSEELGVDATTTKVSVGVTSISISISQNADLKEKKVIVAKNAKKNKRFVFAFLHLRSFSTITTFLVA
jgi:hypothetical protein